MNCTLTTNVDATNGGAGDDTISGLVGVSGTYTLGDNIIGGAGTDTLNLIVASGASAGVAGGLVSVQGVENVNVRLLSTAAEAVTLNAADWSGVATLTNASSLADTVLRVSGLSIATNVTLIGETTVEVGYASLTSGTEAATVTFTGAGSASADKSYADAVSAGTIAAIDVDRNDSGLLDTVNLTLNGKNHASIEGGAELRTLNISGTGNGFLGSDDLLTSINATGAAGNLDITLSGVSEVVVKGGAGNDTLRLGTTISNSDSFDGGDGTDTIVYTQGAFGRNLNTTNVETASITFAAADTGAVNASGSTVTTFNVLAGAASADATINSIADAATVNLTVTAAGLDTVTLDAVSGAQTMTINVGTAGGAGGVDGLVVSDVAAVTINATTGTAGSFTIATSTFDADVKSVTVNTLAGESDLTIADFNAAGVTALSINANGSAGIAFTSGIDGAALVTLTAIASGEGADIAFDTIGTSASALATTNLTFDGRASADITIGAISLGNGVTAASTGTIVMNAGNGSNVGSSATDVTFTGAYTLTLDLNADASGDVAVGHIIVGDGTAGTAQSTAQVINIDALSVGANGSVGIEAILATAATAGVQINIGTITVGSTGSFALTSGILAMTGSTAATDGGANNLDVSSITIDLGTGASATFGAISTTAGAVGAVTVTAVGSGSATFGAINASSIGAITITTNEGSAGTAEVDFAGLTAASNIGAITLNLAGNGDVTVAAISAGGDVGAIEIGVATGATANFDTIGASSVGAISVSGAGFVDFGAISAASVGSINTRNQTSGTFNIDLSAVTNAAEVTLGGATNNIKSGLGNDVITLLAAGTAVAGNDTITYSTGTQGFDNIINFIAGAAASGGDVIAIGGTAMGLENGSGGVASADKAASLLVLGSTSSAMAAGTNIVVMTSAAANTAAMINQVSSQLSFGSAMASAQSNNILVVWTDGTDSYLTTVLVGLTGATSTTTALSSANSVTAGYTLAVLSGVTPSALVAANFDFV